MLYLENEELRAEESLKESGAGGYREGRALLFNEQTLLPIS